MLATGVVESGKGNDRDMTGQWHELESIARARNQDGSGATDEQALGGVAAIIPQVHRSVT